MARTRRSLVHRVGAVAALAVATAALALGTAAPAGAAVPTKNGLFHLKHNQTEFVLAADTLTAGALVRVQRVAPDIAPREQWRVRTNPGTAALTYVLREKIKSGSALVDGCLDLVGDVAQPGKGIVVRPCDGTSSQKWLDVNTLSGGAVFEFENKVGFMKLNVLNAAVGGIAAQQGIVSSAEQKFRRLPL